MHIPSRYTPLVFAFMMSCIMVFVVSGFVTWANVGFAEGFVSRWMHAFIIGWPVAMCCILLFANKVRALTEKLTGQAAHNQEQRKTETQHV